MLIIFVKYYFFLLISIAAFYLLGALIFHLIKAKISNIYADTFAKLFTGIILFVLSSSLYYTKGITINIGFFIVAAFFLKEYYRNKNETNSNETEQKNNIKEYFKLSAEIAIISLAIFFIKFLSIYDASGIPLTPHNDYVYYARLSDFLVTTGKENTTVNYIFPNETGLSPYHYFEIWLNAGLYTICHLNVLLCFTLITYSTGIVIIWIGLCAVFSSFKEIGYLQKILCSVFLLLSGIYLNAYENIHVLRDTSVFCTNLFVFPKTFPVYLFLLASLLCFLKNQYNYALCILLSLPIVYVTCSIGIFISVFIFLSILFFKKDLRFNINNRLAINFFCLFIIFFFIFIFYKLLGRDTSTHVPTIELMVKRAIELTSFKRYVNITGLTHIQIILTHFPVLIMLFYLFGKGKRAIIRENPYVLFAPLIFLGSLLGWVLLSSFNDSSQVFSNTSIPLINLVTAVLFMKIFSSEKKQGYYIIISVFGLMLIANFIFTFKRYKKNELTQSVDYLKKIDSITPGLSERGAYILDKSDYYGVRSCESNCVILGKYLIYKLPHNYQLSLSPHNYVFSTDSSTRKKEEHSIQWTFFYKYVEKQKQKNTFISIAQSRVDFINEFGINYLIITKNVKLDSLIQHKVKREIIDEKTGERFLLF